MNSDKFMITKSDESVARALDRVEALAGCYSFTGHEYKQQIRLLAEELISVIRPALEIADGWLQVSTSGKGMEVTLECSANSFGIGSETRKKILAMDKSEKRGGILGAIGKLVNFLSEPDDVAGSVYVQYASDSGYMMNYEPTRNTIFFSLASQMNTPSKETDDGLEISIVERYADDIRVKLHMGHTLEITVVKKFGEDVQDVEFV